MKNFIKGMTTLDSKIIVTIPNIKIPKLIRNPDAPKKLLETDERVVALVTKYKNLVDKLYELFPYRSIVGSARSCLRRKEYKQFVAEFMGFEPDGTTYSVTTPKYVSQYGDIYFGLDLRIISTKSAKHASVAINEIYGNYDSFTDLHRKDIDRFEKRHGRTVHINTDLVKVDRDVCQKKYELLEKVNQEFEETFTADVKSEIIKQLKLHQMIKYLLTIKLYAKHNEAYNKAYNDAKTVAKEFDAICRWTEYEYKQVSFRVLPQKDDRLGLFEQIVGILSQSTDMQVEVTKFNDVCLKHAIEERKHIIETWRIGSYIDDRDYMELTEEYDE